MAQNPPSGSQPSAARRLAVPATLTIIGAAVAGFWITLEIFHPPAGDERPQSPSGDSPAAPLTAAGQFLLRDVTEEAGLRFRHEAGSTGRFYYPEVMGAGCAFFDADGDGWLDIYLVNGSRLPPDEPSPEIRNALYRNRGDGTFEDITDAAGVGDASYGQGCCAADYDGDGDLDLYVQNYLEYSIEDHKEWYVSIGAERVLDYCSPTGYRGQQDRLYINEGDKSFRDATEESGIEKPGGTGMGLVASDLDDDGDLDIVVSNDSRPNFYFRSEGNGRFTECALEAGLAFNASGAAEAFMGVDAGDYDGDGRIDLAIPTLRQQGFNLYRNLGGTFVDDSVLAGLDAATSAITGFAPVFLDVERDGDLDLFFTAGEVRMGRTDAGAGSSFEERYSLSDRLLENRGGRFVNASQRAGSYFETRRVSRAASAADYDNDGDTDLLVTVMGGRPVLLRNDTRGGSWIGMRLLGCPPNGDAIGARVRVVAGGVGRVREIFAGGSYLGQRDRRIIVGLGEVTRVERVEIRWPDGAESVERNLAAGRYHKVQHPNR